MTASARNNLDRETSPYLLQHRDNPVHWQPWGPQALAAARQSGRPILLSVGYAACHWCHVMAHESFENPEIAAVMNELFVNIKVDREERPDIDAIYQTALQLLGEHGGWPLTMFLNADGEPFWGGTYFPPTPRYGRPGFVDVLKRVAEVYRSDPDTIEKNRRALVGALKARERRPELEGEAPELSVDLLDRIAARLLQEVDTENGGIGHAPKFPQTPLFDLMWRAYLRSGAPMFRDAVLQTLDRMAQGGIYDHLAGGFARYSTDEKWLAPHFEKMLYDNAALIEQMTDVWTATRLPLLEIRVRETVGWVLGEMAAEGGGFAATLDADSEGEEGKFYVWTKGEIDALLGPDAVLFAEAYDVTEGGNWEGRTILNRNAAQRSFDDAEEAALARCRAALLARRATRPRPGWDDKVLADWNGLMIAALTRAGLVFDEPAWIAAAARAFRFVAANMQPAGRLLHSYRAGEARHAALLDDYANMARAGILLHEATGNGEALGQAEAWVETLNRHYWDEAGGGYFLTADDAEALIARTRTVGDNATPNGNGVMLGVLARLYWHTGERDHLARAEALVEAFRPELARNFFPLGTFLRSAEMLMTPRIVVIMGRRGAADADALLETAARHGHPDQILQCIAPDIALPEDHPAAGKGMVGDRAAAYVCVGQTCSLPVTEPAALIRVLQKTW